MMPRMERSRVAPVAAGLIARCSASIMGLAMPRRVNRRSTSSAMRFGSSPTSRAGTNSGNKEAALTKSRSGRRSTTIRLTYQSPSAVSDGVETSDVTGNAVRSFRVGRSITIGSCLRLALSGFNACGSPREPAQRNLSGGCPVQPLVGPPGGLGLRSRCSLDWLRRARDDASWPRRFLAPKRGEEWRPADSRAHAQSLRGASSRHLFHDGVSTSWSMISAPRLSLLVYR